MALEELKLNVSVTSPKGTALAVRAAFILGLLGYSTHSKGPRDSPEGYFRLFWC